jgi:hypothetical protein
MAVAVVEAGVDGVNVEDTTAAAAQWAIPLASVPHEIDQSY